MAKRITRKTAAAQTESNPALSRRGRPGESAEEPLNAVTERLPSPPDQGSATGFEIGYRAFVLPLFDSVAGYRDDCDRIIDLLNASPFEGPHPSIRRVLATLSEVGKRDDDALTIAKLHQELLAVFPKNSEHFVWFNVGRELGRLIELAFRGVRFSEQDFPNGFLLQDLILRIGHLPPERLRILHALRVVGCGGPESLSAATRLLGEAAGIADYDEGAPEYEKRRQLLRNLIAIAETTCHSLQHRFVPEALLTVSGQDIASPQGGPVLVTDLNIRNQTATINGKRVPFGPAEFALLRPLCDAAGSYVSRKALTDALESARQAADPDAFKSALSRLKAKLNTCGITIDTKRGTGSRLISNADRTGE